MPRQDQEMQEHAARIEALLNEADALTDPKARATVVEIVQGLMALYGEGFARILAIIARQEGGANPERTVSALTGDPLVSHLLLLHDLHPVDVEMRVERALEEVRPYLASHGGNVRLIGVEAGIARLRLEGHCKGCPSSTMTLKTTVEEAILKAAPELIGIDAEDAMAPASHPANFVPMSELLVRR